MPLCVARLRCGIMVLAGRVHSYPLSSIVRCARATKGLENRWYFVPGVIGNLMAPMAVFAAVMLAVSIVRFKKSVD